MTPTSPLWLDDAPPPRPPLRGSTRCDALVIGAGLAGSSAALHLAEAGVGVVLLEARQIAASATGRNAGFILQGTAERYDRAVAVMGRERARRIHAWTLQNHTLIAQRVASLGAEVGYRRRGSLQIGDTPQEEHELRASAALLNADGFEARLLEGEDLHPSARRLGSTVGLFLPGDGEVHPVRLVQGLVGLAERAGARVHEGSPVVHLDASTPGAVYAQTPEGEVHAEVVVICTNARAGELCPSLADKVDPVRGQMLATAPLPPLFPCPIYANHGFDYWRQDEAGRLVLGGWRNLDPGAEVGHAETLYDPVQARMTEFVARIGVDPQGITHRWAGIMGFSRDGLPLVGAAPGLGGAVVAAGFTGHGFGFAALAGAALAGLVTEGQHPFCTDLDPRRLS